jgi:hypothetical protein
MKKGQKVQDSWLLPVWKTSSLPPLPQDSRLMNALKRKQMVRQNAHIFTVPVVGVPAMHNREAIYNAKVVFSLVSSRWSYSR